MGRQRWWLLAAALVGALAASAFVLTRDDDAPAEPSAAQPAVYESHPPDLRPERGRRYSRPIGIQTVVPDTVGYPERTAIYALENNDFRVRVMEHRVEAASQDGIVVAQLPRAGGTRRIGWTVTIYVGRLG